jgi:DNA-binding NarL/FixJ family response regulator
MRVLLIDDHRLFRAGLSALLRAWGWDVVGEADDGHSGIDAAKELEPDVVFMDINMPGTNGLAATRAIKTACPDVKVVMLTVSDHEEDLFEAIKSGAEGYLLKNLNEHEFAELVSRVGNGEPVISPTLARNLLTEFARLRPDPGLRESEVELSPREQEVLSYLVTGASNKEMAEQLYVSGNTIGFHMKNILRKLHMRNRSEVIAWAIESGYYRNSQRGDSS